LMKSVHNDVSGDKNLTGVMIESHIQSRPARCA